MKACPTIEKLYKLFIKFDKEAVHQKKHQELPDFTCPLIDEIQAELLEVEKAVNEVKKFMKDNGQRGRIATMTQCSKRLMWLRTKKFENLRRMNENLRETGKAWYLITKTFLARLRKMFKTTT